MRAIATACTHKGRGIDAGYTLSRSLLTYFYHRGRNGDLRIPTISTHTTEFLGTNNSWATSLSAEFGTDKVVSFVVCLIMTDPVATLIGIRHGFACGDK